MKKLFATAFVLALTAAAPAAYAQDEHDQGTKSDSSSKAGDAKVQDQAPAQDHPAKVQKIPAPNATTAGHTHKTVTHTGNAMTTGPAHAAAPTGNAMATGPAHNAAPTGNAMATGATPATTAKQRSPAIVALRLNVQASHQFHAGTYRQPQGYTARHWSYGDNLPGSYYARDYWLTDYAMYALFAPPDGLVWVRVDNDALLIDEDTGEIIQVEYGVFY